jgi:hypothetical protein
MSPEPPTAKAETPPAEAAVEAATEAKAVQEVSSEPTTPEALGAAEVAGATEAFEDDEFDEAEEIPGEQDPASFVNFMMSLASQAATALGAMPHPMTGQRTLDLDVGKHWIDTLAMLKDKTKGNLHPKEEQLLAGLLSDLRMQFIQLSQAAEERLKQQAAQKFSSKDVLGGR